MQENAKIADHEKAYDADEYVAFRIGEQEYCVDIKSVREIRGWTSETMLPQSPDYVRGVINLRGTVLPIVDLAHRLGLGKAQPSERHVIIIAHVDGQVFGLLVDAVSDIISVTSDTIQPTPDVANETAKKFVAGVIADDSRMISLVEPERVLPSKEAVAA